MALTGLDIFKLTPKTNCKDCGNPTCMAFAMKVAQGAIPVTKCPHMSPESLAKLSEATEPPMKTIEIRAHKLGGETVLLRHEKTLVNKSLFAVRLSADMDDAQIDALLEETKKVDYVRIGERMYVECLYLACSLDEVRSAAVAKKAAAASDALLLDCPSTAVAEAALKEIKDKKPVLLGADAGNYEAMTKLATANGLVLGVKGKDLSDLHDTVEKLEKLGNKNLILDVGACSIADAFANAVKIRRAALKDNDRTFGYPALVNAAALAPGDMVTQAMLASMFTLRYGSVIVLEHMTYAEALPLYGLRQNIFTDPQKPMKVTPGVYPINGADENAISAITVDFALTYFVVSGEMERSGVPVNLLICDAGGYSVLTAWAAGKLSASSIAKFVQEQDIEQKIKNRVLILPGKVAVLKGEIEEKLPGWKVVVGTNEAIQLVRFLREFKGAAV